MVLLTNTSFHAFIHRPIRNQSIFNMMSTKNIHNCSKTVDSFIRFFLSAFITVWIESITLIGSSCIVLLTITRHIWTTTRVPLSNHNFETLRSSGVVEHTSSFSLGLYITAKIKISGWCFHILDTIRIKRFIFKHLYCSKCLMPHIFFEYFL